MLLAIAFDERASAGTEARISRPAEAPRHVAREGSGRDGLAAHGSVLVSPDEAMTLPILLGVLGAVHSPRPVRVAFTVTVCRGPTHPWLLR